MHRQHGASAGKALLYTATHVRGPVPIAIPHCHSPQCAFLGQFGSTQAPLCASVLAMGSGKYAAPYSLSSSRIYAVHGISGTLQSHCYDNGNSRFAYADVYAYSTAVITAALRTGYVPMRHCARCKQQLRQPLHNTGEASARIKHYIAGSVNNSSNSTSSRRTDAGAVIMTHLRRSRYHLYEQ